MPIIDELGASIFDTFFTNTGPKWFYYPIATIFYAICVALGTIAAQKYAEVFGTSFAKDIDAVKTKSNKPSGSVGTNAMFNFLAFGFDGALLFAYLPYSSRIYWDIDDVVFNFTWTEFTMHMLGVAAWVALMVVIYDGQIYFFHRLEHEIPFLYRHFHVQHHENLFPGSWFDGVYGDTLEGQVVAFFALWPVAVFPISITAVVAYAAFITTMVQINHSGYHIRMPLIAYDSYMHLMHHQRRMCNYAEHTWFWDYMFGTLQMRPITLEKEVGPLVDMCSTKKE